MTLDPVKTQRHIAELVTFFILMFVTFFFNTYQNVNERLQKIEEKQERQTVLLEKLYEEKIQNEKKYPPRYKIYGDDKRSC